MSNPPTRSPRDLTWLVILAFSLIWLPFIHSRAFSTNDASRMATIESLVHRGAWAIDGSPFAHTVDKIQVGDQFYSSKPPTLAFLGAGIYTVLHNGLGLNLRWEECVPRLEPSRCRALFAPGEADWAYVVLVFLLVATPATLMLALTYRLARWRGMSNWASLLFVAVLGLGTALWPYSTIFVNHLLAAAGIATAVYLLLRYGQPTAVQLAMAGFAVTLGATIDLSVALFLLGLFVYVAWRYRQRVLYFALGALLPGLLAIALNFQITGTPLPPQLYTAGYDFQGSAFRLAEPVRLLFAGRDEAEAAVTDEYVSQVETERGSFAGRVGRHLFQMSVGEYGVFAFYPIVLWYVVALLRALRVRDSTTRGVAMAMSATTLLYVAYFGLRPHTFGGFVFGPRWLLNPVPALALFAVDPALYRPRRVWRFALLGGLAALSIVTAYTGTVNPWAPSYPLLRLTWAPPAEPENVATALSGYGRSADAEPDVSATFGLNRVNGRWFDARSGFVVPPQPTWWFIHDSTPAAAPFAQVFGLQLETTYGLYTDFSPAARAWLDGFETAVYASPQLYPQDGEATAVSTPVTLTLADDSVDFVGYQWTQTENAVQLTTAWEIRARSYPTGDRRIFVHLLATDGAIVAQQDAFAARYDSLFPGDLYFQLHTLPLDGVGNGRYWLQIGMYDPATGARLQAGDGVDRLLLTPVEIGE